MTTSPGEYDPTNFEPPAGPRPGAEERLAQAVIEIERHVAAAGWDGPIRVFALVRTAAALATDAAIGDLLTPAVLAAAADDPNHLTSIEQEQLPAAETLGDLLAQLAWPSSVDGVAIVTERVVVPSSVEAHLPQDREQATRMLVTHPQRQDVRMVAGVLRDGPAWCALRTRTVDDDAAVAQGADLIPELVEALRATLD